MTEPERPMRDSGDERLTSALRAGLGARDRSQQPAHFRALWPGDAASRSRSHAWRPALAALAAIAVIAGLSWTLLSRHGSPEQARLEARVDPSLAHELSSPDFWRVPTDELLAYAAPPAGIELPSPPGFEVSLEESLL